MTARNNKLTASDIYDLNAIGYPQYQIGLGTELAEPKNLKQGNIDQTSTDENFYGFYCWILLNGGVTLPTAALDGAPVFTGTPATISPTAALDAAPTFTGTALATDLMFFIDDDNAAANGTQLFAFIKKNKMEEAYFCSENASTSTSFFNTNGALSTFVAYKPIANHVINITDADGAAGSGVVMYAHLVGDGQKAILKFVSPTSAMGSFTCNNGGDTVYVIDSDTAADGGVQVYFDEDGTDGSRLLINSPIGKDLYVETSTGRWIKLTHNADPATPGVLVYFDEDAGNSYERLLFVSPTNTNGTNTNLSAAAWSVVKDEIIIPLYVDEDGTNGSRLQHAASAAIDIKVPAIDTTDGTAIVRLINIAYSATAAADGVAPYFDDDGLTESQRVLFVSPTNTSVNNLLDASSMYYGKVAEGTNDAPGITVTGAAYTPAGTNSVPTITVSGSYGPTDENSSILQTMLGNSFQITNIGTRTNYRGVQTANGWDFAGEAENDEGCEINQGNTQYYGKHFFTPSSDNFYFETKVKISDVSETDTFLAGFRKAEAHQDDYNDYDEMFAINVDAGNVKATSILNNGTTASTDLLIDVADTNYIISRFEYKEATGLASAIALANSLKAIYTRHIADVTQHTTAADATNVITAADAKDLATLITLVSDLLTQYDAHEGDSELAALWLYHAAQETGDASLVSSAAPTTLTECITRLNDLKTKFKTHDDDATSHAVATQYPISVGYATCITYKYGVNTETLTTYDNALAGFAFDSAEVILPFIQFQRSSANALTMELMTWKVGNL